MTAGIAVAESTAAAANCVVMNAVNAPSAQEREVQPVPAMSTVEFLRSIWPSTGLYVIARFTDKGWRHTVCDTIEEAAAYAHQFDAQGVPTYMACAAYREREVVTTKPNGDVRRQVRIGRNVRAVRCFWMDLDVKPGVETAYESQDAAIDGIVEFCQATGLPTPMVVSSGGGVHIYFRLTEEIAPEAWKPTAEGLKSLAIKYRLKADHACTADPARVLRPVGTLNRKLVGCLRPVELIADADPIDFAQFKTAVDGALNRAGLEAPPEGVRAAESATEGINQAFAIQHNFPPCSATRVAERCAQLAAVRDARGNVPEPHWYSAIQLLCHSVEGDALIHEWSEGYAGYSKDETDRKIAQIRGQHLGPTLCNTFAGRNPGGCDGCPFQGKISSPVQLGHNIPCPPPIASAVVPEISKETISATDIAVPVPQATAAPTPALWILDDLNSKYAWVQRQKQFFRFEHSDFIKPEQFRIALANQPRVALGNPPKLIAPADAWIRWQTRREHLDIVYEPGKPPIHDNQINLWKGWGCVPTPGGVAPWSDLLDEAFGSGTIERIYFEQWIAFQIQRPGVKLFSAVVLWSPQQGVGKTLIGETCAKLFGENAGTITNSDISGAFNEWVKGRQFILGEEIMSDDHRSAMNLLKHLITGETIRVNEKNQPKITLRNTINFMFTSNHPNAVQIDRNDRRFFVVEFAGGKRAPQFFTDFVNWRDEQGGLRALMHHLLQVSLDGFDPKAAPPATSAKEQMMEATFTDLERWIYDRYIDLAVPLQCEVVYAGDIANQYYGHKGQHATETAVGRALTRAGRCAKKRVTLSYGARKQLCAPRRYPYWSIAPEKAWAEEYEKGQLIGAQISAAITRVPATVPQSRHGLN